MSDLIKLCIQALKTQRQIDEDGCEVAVSRQACDVAAAELERLTAELATAKADRNTYDSAHKTEAANVLRLTAENAALRADAERKYRALREYDCPRPINSAQDESTGWCVDNGHCGCGRNHALGVRKGHGYPDAAIDACHAPKD